MLAELIGRAVCARDPTHGLPGVAHALPLCARCAAMHLAVAIGWLAWRRRADAAGPRSAIGPLLAVAALLAPMAVDVAGIGAGLWAGSAWGRLATGVAGGLGIGLGLRIAEALAASGVGVLRLPRPALGELGAGALASALALLAPLLGPPAVGEAVTAGAVVASASLTVFVALSAATGARGGLPARAAAVAIAAGALLLVGRAR